MLFGMETLPHEKEIVELEKTLALFKEKNKKHPLVSLQELRKLEKKLDEIKEKVYSNLTPWQRVLICRHPNRPRSLDYIKNLCEEFIELCGDRSFSDDRAVVGGLAQIEGKKFVVVGQEKGSDTESRLTHNFGMVHPEGYRKALRLARFGEKFGLPLLFLLDTPGAYPGLTAEERGQGLAIAYNLRELFTVATPIIVLIIGEGCSGGALGMGIGDRIAMLEHSYYSVVSPEGCASILWKEAHKKEHAAEVLKMQSENLLEYGIIDQVIKEPTGGAHHQTAEIYTRVKKFILDTERELSKIPLQDLLEERYQKFRKIGSHETAPQGSSSQ